MLNELLSIEPTSPGFTFVPFWESLRANGRQETYPTMFEDADMLFAEQQFNAFSAKSFSSSIPSMIHLIWLGSTPPPIVQLGIASWKKHHPTWTVKLWTDEEIASLSWSHPRSQHLFASAKNWAEKSDVLRFEILYQFGGIYADTDMICLKPLDPIIQSGVLFFSGFEDNEIKHFRGKHLFEERPLVGSSIIGSIPRHPILHRCLSYSSTEQEEPNVLQPMRSGPGPLSKACYEALADRQEGLLIFPSSYFFPFPQYKHRSTFREVLGMIRPESFTIHFWEGSWFRRRTSADTRSVRVCCGKDG